MATRTPLDVCIVTCDITGPIRNGGIGTAYHSLARLLAASGHRVTVLYGLGKYCEQESIEHWQDVYRSLGITLVPAPAADDVRGHPAMRVSVAVYRWLRHQSFDIVHFHEWRGVAFYTVLAKAQGLALENATLCVGAHSPVLWHKEGMNELATPEDLEVDYMERQSVEHADILWSPSEHMLAWLAREGWRTPRRVVLKPYVVLDHERHATSASPCPVDELVFFGRLETRKGLELFCDALDRLVRSGVQIPAVTFLGKPASVSGMPSETYLKARGVSWPFPWKIVSGLDRHAAVRYLREPGRMAVLPSRIDNLPYTVLECLAAGVPFLASRTGGIPEMIRAEDRSNVLFDLTAESMAMRIEDILAAGARPVAPRHAPERVNAEWLRWHAVVGRRRRRSKPVPAQPHVTVCLTHFNRPSLLAHAIESLRRQDYPHFDLVLVDDGSDRPEALQYLERLEPEFDARGWTIVRQPNRYLGAARNTALAHARGEYVLFMDDDNVAEPHELGTFARAATASGADILTCFLRIFQGEGAGENEANTATWPFLGGGVAPGVTRNTFGDANAFIRRSSLDRIGRFTEEVGVGCEDWEFFARAALRGCRIMVVPEPLVRYRQSGQGMLSTTSRHANRMRALRPYFEHVPAELRGLVHLTQQPLVDGHDGQRGPAKLDHVRYAVVFGTGEAGRAALNLATRCGWDVKYLVDNNPGMWSREAHGRAVRPPQSLATRDYDLVIVASVAGKPAIFKQLQDLGLSHSADFVHFLEPVTVAGVTAQVVLP